jgi:hypothetical protein
MAAETDIFIIATYALWAGDFAYAEDLLQEYSPPHQTPAISRNGIESPEAILRAIGALRLRQLRQKRGEFRRLAAEQVRNGVELTGEPTILETKHLRSTLWRRDERTFVMRGYLKSLLWDRRLLECAHNAAETASHFESKQSPTRDELLESAESHYPIGASWVIEGELFIQVEVTDLGQIEARGVWTRLRLPQDSEPVIGPFFNLLQSLDRPVDKGDIARNPPTPE